MFYTYAHTKPDGTIFYIGKGQKKRAWRKNGRNTHWKNIVVKYKNYGIEILANWKTEQEAFDHEVLLISCFKDMGYELANLTAGGEGVSNPSSETRAKLSESHKGPKNGFFGKKHSNEVKNKMSKERIGKKHSSETKLKIGMSQLGKQHSVESRAKMTKHTIIATNTDTKKTLELFGSINIKSKGFDVSHVYSCLNGKRKTHKGHTFKRLEKK
jgi:hypothetical protein